MNKPQLSRRSQGSLIDTEVNAVAIGVGASYPVIGTVTGDLDEH